MLDEIAVLSKFEKFGFDHHSLITREQLAALLRRLTRENKGPKAEEWPTELIDELCRECKLNSKGQLEIHQYVQVIVRAQHQLTDKVRVLTKRVSELAGQQNTLKREIEMSREAGRFDLVEERRNVLTSIEAQLASDREMLSQYETDLQSITIPFNVEPRVKTPVYAAPKRSPLPQRRYYSDSLKDVFWLTVVLLCLETFVSISRGNFLNLMLVICLLSMLFLGYFSSKIIKIILAGVLFCVMADVLWLVVKSKNFCIIEGHSQYSSSLKLLHLIEIFISLIICIPTKVLVIVRLFPYRNGWKDADQVLAIKICGNWEINFRDLDQ